MHPDNCLMDEQTRIWRQIGLHYVFRTQPNRPEEAQTEQPIDLRDSAPALFGPVDEHVQNALQFYWKRIQPPVIVFTTYATLDQDFRGPANRDRLNLLHSIIKVLPWSLSDIAFWPMTLYKEALSPHDANAILDALIIDLRPQYLLDFGGIVREFSLQPLDIHGRSMPSESSFRHITLPALDAMLPDNKVIKRQAWDIIRRLTS